MKQDKHLSQKEKEEMKKTIDFKKYGESNKNYTMEELINIYKTITKDIQDGKA